MTDYPSLEAAFADGAFVPIPVEIETDHDAYPSRAAHVALQPMTVADEYGPPRRLGPGDLLSRSKCLASGTALAGMVRRGAIVRLPSDSGVVGLVPALAAHQ
jgi:hypothetical protein